MKKEKPQSTGIPLIDIPKGSKLPDSSTKTAIFLSVDLDTHWICRNEVLSITSFPTISIFRQKFKFEQFS